MERLERPKLNAIGLEMYLSRLCIAAERHIIEMTKPRIFVLERGCCIQLPTMGIQRFWKAN
jgi:hypothetical protein